ncbi:MAG: hypothetical protein R6U29_12565 [Desulfosudaceae bacterium]
MFFKQIVMNDSGALSYFIGCSVGQTACVVNPRKNIHEYIETSVSNNMKITAIFETAGFEPRKSGKDKLAALTGAPIFFLEKKENPGDQQAGKKDVFIFGNAEIHIVNDPQYATNGNAILLRDRSNDNKPWLVLNRRCVYADNLGTADLNRKNISDRLMVDYLDFYQTDADTGLTDNMASLSRNMFQTSRTEIAKMSLPV